MARERHICLFPPAALVSETRHCREHQVMEQRGQRGKSAPDFPQTAHTQLVRRRDALSAAARAGSSVPERLREDAPEVDDEDDGMTPTPTPGRMLERGLLGRRACLPALAIRGGGKRLSRGPAAVPMNGSDAVRECEIAEDEDDRGSGGGCLLLTWPW